MRWNEEISTVLPGKALLVAFSGESVLPGHRAGFVKAVRTEDSGLARTPIVLREEHRSDRKFQTLARAVP